MTADQVVAQEIVNWLDENRMRVHAPDCVIHKPSACCNCGLHTILVYARAIVNNNVSLFLDNKLAAKVNER